MGSSYVTGRAPRKRPPGAPRDETKVKANSSLPKGTRYTTPEREPIREAERLRKAEADLEFIEGRRALNNVLKEDPEAVKRVWAKLLEVAEGGHYKAAELVLGYAYGKPIATQLNGAQELSGDDLYDATEQVGEKLAQDGWSVIEGGKAVESA